MSEPLTPKAREVLETMHAVAKQLEYTKDFTYAGVEVFETQAPVPTRYVRRLLDISFKAWLVIEQLGLLSDLDDQDDLPEVFGRAYNVDEVDCEALLLSFEKLAQEAQKRARTPA